MTDPDEEQTPTRPSRVVTIMAEGLSEVSAKLVADGSPEALELYAEADKHMKVLAAWATSPPGLDEVQAVRFHVFRFYQRAIVYLEKGGKR